MTRKPRRLTPEERELWAHVAASAQPFHASPKRVADMPDTPKPKKKPRPEVTDFRIGQSAPDYAFRHDLAPSLSDKLAHAPLRMDRKTHRTMTRGKLRPEARIDLHGETLGQAHPDLIRFITGAHAQGLATGAGHHRQGQARAG